MTGKSKRLILITGNGRSGTLTMTHQLKKALGLDVGHEYVREDGCCSMYFFDPKLKDYPYIPWGPPKGLNAHVGQKMTDFKFENIFHQIRNPILCIPSMAMIYSRPIMDWFEVNKLCDPEMKNRLHKCMAIWLEVNTRAEKIADYRYKIEEVSAHWPKLVRRMGFDSKTHPMVDVGMKHRATKSRKRIVTWDELSEIDTQLTKSIKKMARRYRYDV